MFQLRGIRSEAVSSFKIYSNFESMYVIVLRWLMSRKYLLQPSIDVLYRVHTHSFRWKIPCFFPFTFFFFFWLHPLPSQHHPLPAASVDSEAAVDAISGMATRTVKVSPHLIRAIGGHLSERGEVLHYGCDGSMGPFLTLASIDGKRKRERERKTFVRLSV